MGGVTTRNQLAPIELSLTFGNPQVIIRLPEAVLCQAAILSLTRSIHSPGYSGVHDSDYRLTDVVAWIVCCLRGDILIAWQVISMATTLRSDG